ncbi:MAG: TRAP transporter large permease subunit [Rhodospirillaceae bacterium]|jgi:C4-dicarboxylate transporter, DctM subunit|nr:TRAP transporter large permease subunit [Rhodospirillaceae bacterium]MBT7954596.1 TRAP transporter large permease subunit [Rhodospirillaceae bacterium]
MGKFYAPLVSGLNIVGSIWIFVIMVLINADVFSRYLFNSPIRGIPTIVSMSIIAIVFFQLPDALRSGRMTRNDVLIGKLLASPSGSGHRWQAAYYLLGAFLMALIIYFSIPFLGKAWHLESYVGTQGDFIFSDWPILAVVILGALFCGLEFVFQVKRDISAHISLLGQSVRSVLGAALPLILVIAVATILVFAPLSNLEIAVTALVLVLVLVYVGVHIGVALSVISFFAIWGIRDDVLIAGKMLSSAASESLQRFEFGIIPLFILMGTLISVSDVGADLYKVANQLFRRLKGGLGMATVFANAIFAATTGASIASASVFTQVAVPEMLKMGYTPRFSVGVVAGSSVLGMLIPPSMLMILYGILTESSIGDLFIAGIVPGIVLSVAYCLMIYVMAMRFPRMVISEDHKTQDDSLMPMGELLRKLVPIMALIVVVMGGIYGGFFTATEAGGIGAFGALLMALARRSLTWQKFWHILTETGQITAAICFLFISAHIYARMITVTGLPNALEDLINVSEIGFIGLLAVYLIIIIILGTILDAGSIMLIMVPIVIPLFIAMEASGVDIVSLTWIGVLTIIGVEIGLLTPPLGIACFVIHNNLQDESITVGDIFRGAAPFALMMFLVLILIVIFPQIALVLL